MPQPTPTAPAAQMAINLGNMQSQRNGLVRVMSNDQIDALKQLEDEAEKPDSPVMTDFAAHLGRLWQQAEDSKRDIEQVMLQNLRQRKGEYESEQLQAIAKQGGSDMFLRLTAVKCQAAEAWIEDILSPNTEKFWGLDPTSMPEMPESVVQGVIAETMSMVEEHIAQGGDPISPEDIFKVASSLRGQVEQRMKLDSIDKAERMEKLITDQFNEANFYEAFLHCLSDLVTYPAGFIKGPVIRYERQIKWMPSANGPARPVLAQSMKPSFSVPSPFDMYPSPHAAKLNEHFIFERMRIPPDMLERCIGVPGFSEEAISRVLGEVSMATRFRDWNHIDQAREAAEDRPYSLFYDDNSLCAKEYWGTISGEMLKGFGILDAEDKKYYSVTGWLIGRHVVMARVNPLPLGLCPYSKACYESVPGSFWGYGVPQKMADIQGMVNACSRALVNNMGISSGPQAWIDDINRLAEGEEIDGFSPWKLWQFNNDSNSTRAPMGFFQPDSNAATLLKVGDYYHKLADDHTGIPAYTYGNENLSGAGRTSSGLSMLMNSASRGIKKIISNMDNGITKPTVHRMFLHNMLYSPDDSIKGDVIIKPRGAVALVVKEQMQLRRQEFLNTTNNPTDMAIIGPEGRAKVLRKTAQVLDMPEDIVPSDEVINARFSQPPPQPDGNTQGAPAQ